MSLIIRTIQLSSELDFKVRHSADREGLTVNDFVIRSLKRSIQEMKIKEIIETREFHNLVLNRYRGPYALGLSGENKVTVSLPDTVEADQVVAQTISFGSLKTPKPLRNNK